MTVDHLTDYLGKRHLPEVLIVDDDKDFCEVASLMIESLRIGRPIQAANGEDAIGLTVERRPPIVLLDQAVSGLDGETVASTLKLFSPTSSVIAVSAILDDKPSWAIGFVPKHEFARLLGRIAELKDGQSHEDLHALWLLATTHAPKKASPESDLMEAAQ